MYFLHGAHNIASIWKYGSSITTPKTQASFLINIFGMDKRTVNMIEKDNSGILPLPHADSIVEPRNRIDYHTRVGFNKNLNGDRLKNMFKRWASIFEKQLEGLPINTEWTEGEHIMDFWIPVVSRSVNETIAGPLLECINPDFTRNFLEYLPYAHTLMKGFPKWCIPRAASLRTNLIQTVRQWHAIARSCFNAVNIDVNDGADPWWGSAWIRERHKFFKEVDGFGTDAVASLDFGLLWG